MRLACGTLGLLALGSVLAAGTAPHWAATGTPSQEWPHYGNDKGHMRFSPLTQITPENVASLQPAWTYRMGPPGVQLVPGPLFGGAPGGADQPAVRRYAASQVTPLVINGVMYLTTPYNRIVALDAATGTEIWTTEGRGSTRGLEYWPGDDAHPARVIYAQGASLVALDASTGKPATSFGTNGTLASEGSGATSPPILYRNTIISQSANPNRDGRDGDVRAFDVVTGKQLWRFATIPEPGQKNAGTWPEDSTAGRRGARVWGLMTVDTERGIVYFPVNAPSWDRFGGDRLGDNLYSSSIVAVDAATGEYRWHFQIVHHDIWDFDPAAAPMLIDVRKDGRTIPAVAITSKSGLIFLFDRVTGAAIHGVEERPVPASEIPGERTAPTQPFPVKPAPIARQSMSRDDIATVTPELEKYCRDLVEKSNIGMGGPYLPPGHNRPTVNFPGTIGSANWGGMSFSPPLGYLFVNSHDLGQLTGIGPKGSIPREVIGVAGAGPGSNPRIEVDMVGLLGRFKEPKSNMMCQQPPWGSLTAVDVNTGDIAWQVPLGVTDGLPEDRRNTGRPNLGGSIVTASGLVFIGATDDNRFRAFDARTGKEVWTVKLAAANHSVPISYMARGRQFVAFPATGGSFLQDPVADDALIAYALPVTPARTAMAAVMGQPARAQGATGAPRGTTPLSLQAGANPVPAPLLFSESWNGLPMAQPITREHLANQHLALHLYGDVAAIRKSQHPVENYLYTGESVTNWGLTLSDPRNHWDLSGNARIRLKTRNSGYRRLHVMIRTADNQWYVSEEGNGESTAWIEVDYIPADLHWRELMMEDKPTNRSNQRQPDPRRQPLVATSPATPDLTRIAEVGFTDLMPGGWIPSSSRVNAISVFGKAVPKQD